MRYFLLSCLLAAPVFWGGCHAKTLEGKACLEDKDCGSPASAYRCESQGGQCYCRTNQACPGGQFCNAGGFCQSNAGCEKNADCLDASLICDTDNGQCMPLGRCRIDLHCPLGKVCDTDKSTCIEGCRRNGDCAAAASSCRCGDVACACEADTQEALARCEMGVCDAFFCSDSSHCAFGEKCVPNSDASGKRATCVADYHPRIRPYCDNCTYGAGQNTCGSGPHFCLVDVHHGGKPYCGVDCSQSDSCPRGYSCREVIIVFSRWACTAANPTCPTNETLPCATDADCKHGGRCVKASSMPNGYCAGQCNVQEGHARAFCSCQVDSDCPQESCTAGKCTITRQPCIDSDDCQSIRCVDVRGRSGCRIGYNCAPANGLSCIETK